MDCKAAGASSWRNSRLKSIAAEEDGLSALLQWSQLWISGKVPECMAKPWRVVLGIPLRKGDGEDVRPVLIGEALLSLPGACLQEATRAKVTKLIGATQFGIGIAGREEIHH